MLYFETKDIYRQLVATVGDNVQVHSEQQLGYVALKAFNCFGQSTVW